MNSFAASSLNWIHLVARFFFIQFRHLFVPVFGVQEEDFFPSRLIGKIRDTEQ